MNVYGQLIKASFEKTSTDLTDTFEGLFFYNTTTKLVKFRTNAALKTFVDTDTNQLLSNKEHDIATMVQQATPGINPATGKVKLYLKSDKRLFQLDENGVERVVGDEQNVSTLNNQATTPSNPVAGKVKIYTKTDKNAYILDDTGVEKPLGSGSGASSLIWEKLGDTSPNTILVDGMRLEEFAETDTQEIYTTILIPSTYISGTQIKLMNGSFFCSAITGKVFFKADVSLIRPGLTVLGTYSNNLTSTNTEVTVAGVSNQLKNTGDLNLTDANGQINAISVAPGDKLRVRLYRAIASESVSAAASAKLLINTFEIKLTR